MSQPINPSHERIARLLGRQGLEILAESTVAVVGLGAVGGYAVEALARAGVGRLRVVDFDVVGPSNINRQLLATCETIGQSKAKLARQRIETINPDCQVEAMEQFADERTCDEILSPPIDLAIDAIDAVGPKVQLIAAAFTRQVAIISAMGAALRTDPTRIAISPLSQTHTCPLARQIRRKLPDNVDPSAVTCVWSDEPAANLPEHAVGEPEAEVHFSRGRPRRTLGSLPTLTGMFGLACANAAIQHLLGPHWPG